METYSEQISYCESTNLVGFLSEWEYQQGEKWKFSERFKTIKGSIIDGDYDILATFGENNTTIYSSKCSFLDLGLDTGSCPSVIEDL